MDGYAVRAAETGPGVWLKVTSTVAAGERALPHLGPGECARIFTGAPLPPGADAVVMQEHVVRGQDRIELRGAIPPRANVRESGEDARAGELLLPRQTALGLAELSLLWAQGFTSVPVPTPPRVALFSTGDELRSVGEPADLDRIVDTNTPALARAVQRAGGVPVQLARVPDDFDATLSRLEEASGFEVVITTAGASVGDRDHVIPALEALGVELRVKKVAIKPGKPFTFGVRDRALFFALPGNPTSALVTFELFVRPLLRRLAGIADVAPPRIPGRVGRRLEKAIGLTHYLRAAVRYEADGLWCEPLASQTSGALRSAAATHLIELPAAVTCVEPGGPVALLPVSWAA